MSLPRESKIIILIQRGADTPSLHIITRIPLRGAYSIEIEVIASRVCVCGVGGEAAAPLFPVAQSGHVRG